MTVIARSGQSLKTQIRKLLEDQNTIDWTMAAIMFAWSTDESGVDNPHERGVVAALGIVGWANPQKIKAFQDAYRLAMEEGVVPFVGKGDQVVITTASFSHYLESTQWRIKARAKRNEPKPSIQGERDKTSDPKQPSGTRQDSGPRVSTLEARADRALQEVKASIKQETDPARKMQWELAKVQLENVARQYQKAGVSR